MNLTQLGRNNYWAWVADHQTLDVQYFLYKKTGEVFKLVRYEEWDGYTGKVRLELFPGPDNGIKLTQILSYTGLIPLNEMEVLAHSARD